jgi:hypothetical protein
MNRRQDKKFIIVETAIYRVFVMVYKKNSELRSQKKAMNSVRVGNEYWLKPRKRWAKLK